MQKQHLEKLISSDEIISHASFRLKDISDIREKSPSELNNTPLTPRSTHPPQTMRQTRCVVQALVVFIKNNFGSKNSTLDSVILSIKKTIIQEQIQKILNYENKSIKAPFIYIMYTQTGRDSQSRRIKSTVIA